MLNDADFLANVGDRGVHTVEDAERYIETGPRASYAIHGFGLWAVEVRDGGACAGICGLLRRDTLDAPDVGFALLPEFRSRGYATEAARASLVYGMESLGLRRVLAIVKPENVASLRVLETLEMSVERCTRLVEEGPELLVFTTDANDP